MNEATSTKKKTSCILTRTRIGEEKTQGKFFNPLYCQNKRGEKEKERKKEIGGAVKSGLGGL